MTVQVYTLIKHTYIRKLTVFILETFYHHQNLQDILEIDLVCHLIYSGHFLEENGNENGIVICEENDCVFSYLLNEIGIVEYEIEIDYRSSDYVVFDYIQGFCLYNMEICFENVCDYFYNRHIYFHNMVNEVDEDLFLYFSFQMVFCGHLEQTQFPILCQRNGYDLMHILHLQHL